ncbi:MAG: homoserine kinase, partial [Brevundimonas sp.]
HYDLGGFRTLTPIAEGVENSNFRLETDSGHFVLTLFESRTEAASLAGWPGRWRPASTPARRPSRP